ncbi:hypothetical protein MTO96_005377 [Rhipicephalus appendiculatus]
MHQLLFSSLVVSVAFATIKCQIQVHYPTPDPPVLRAVAALTTGSITGTIQFIKENPYAQVQVHGNVTGLNPGKHGFHVHRFGDLTGGCKSAAAHYNPANADHGAPSDDIRHIGDLGNIEADVNGVALFSFYDRLLSLEGSFVQALLSTAEFNWYSAQFQPRNSDSEQGSSLSLPFLEHWR